MRKNLFRGKRVLEVLFTAIMVLSMLFPAGTVVLAQDEVPPADSQPAESVEAADEQPAAEAPEVVAEEQPAAEAPAPVVLEQATVEVPEPVVLEQATIEAPAPEASLDPIELVQATVEVVETSDVPLVEATVEPEPVADASPETAEVPDEVKVAEAIDALAESDSSLINAAGEVVPLATIEAVEILADGDPVVERGFVSYYFLTDCTGVSNCYESATPVSAAVAFALDGETIKIAAGTYSEDVTIDKNVTLQGVLSESSGGVGDVFINTVRLFSDITAWTNIFVANVFVNPGANLDDAIAIADDGGTVNVASGTYTINDSLVVDKSLTIRGKPGDETEAGAAADAPVIQPATAATFDTTTHTTTNSAPLIGIITKSSDIKIEGLMLQGFNVGIQVLDDPASTNVKNLEINNNTFLNNIQYDVQFKTDPTNPEVNYNAFLDTLYPAAGGGYYPLGYAIYKPNETSQLYTIGDFWGYDTLWLCTSWTGHTCNSYGWVNIFSPVGYRETVGVDHFNDIIGYQLHNDSKLVSELGDENEIPAGFVGTFRQGIVNGFTSKSEPATIKVKLNPPATSYTIPVTGDPQCPAGQVWNGTACVTQTTCGANQVPNGAGGCTCATGYVDGPEAGLNCVLPAVTCDDGDPLTTDTWDGTKCVYTPIVCDDGDPTTTDTLNPDGTCTYTPKVCNDGDPTTTDTLNPDGTCTYTPKVCNDGDPTTTDTLNPDGTCTYTPKVCNDGDPTTTDTLNPDGTCTYTPKVCNDGDPTTTDTLNPDGTCTYTPIVCDDGNPNTTDTLNPDGTCTYAAILPAVVPGGGGGGAGVGGAAGIGAGLVGLPLGFGGLIPVTGGDPRLIAAGIAHTCAVTPEGGVQCWGDNEFGQLGDGTNTDSNVRVTVPGLEGVVSIVAGGNHTCVLESDGSVWCWGENTYGQVGNGSTSNSNVAVKVLDGAVDVTAGLDFTCAVMGTGEVMCWGNNSQGQLADGTTTNHTSPAYATLIAGVSKLTAGQNTTCGLTQDGKIYCWSDGKGWQAVEFTAPSSFVMVNRFAPGVLTLDDKNSPSQWPLSGKPAAVSVAGVTFGDSGLASACVLKEDGSVECWGANSNGELGNGTLQDSMTPGAVTNLSGAYALAVGEHHACALAENGDIMCWGLNSNGQLGDGTNTNSDVPVIVK